MPLRPSVLLLSALLGLTQCIMQEGGYSVHPMPEATQTGANTAGCLVDGLPWVASHNGTMMGGGPLPAVRATWSKVRPPAHHLSLSFSKYIDDEAHVHARTNVRLELPDITRPGTFVLDQAANPQIGNGPTAYAAFTFNRASPSLTFLTGSAYPGRVVVTRFDTLSRVVSGTFEFTANQATGGRPVRVAEGRFDCEF